MHHTPVDVLNSFLRGEISAVETYHQALYKVVEPERRTQLEECLVSHQMRVDVLTRRIMTLGGEPATDSGPWGTFAKLIQGSADALGESSAIRVLEEGEDHGRDDYRRELAKLDGESRKIIESQILPEQERTHHAMSALKHTLH